MVIRKLICNKSELIQAIKEIEQVPLDKPHTLEFKQFRKTRSLKQNSLMWLWLRCIADELGDDAHSLHDEFCDMFLPWQEVQVLKSARRKTVGTKDLNSKEFDTFLEQIRMYVLNNFNITLPLPDDVGWDEFYAKFNIN
jgi:hypothetical protein